MDIDHSDPAAIEPARSGKGKNKAPNVAEMVASDNLKVGEQGVEDADMEAVTITNNPTRIQKTTASRVDHEKESLRKKVHEVFLHLFPHATRSEQRSSLKESSRVIARHLKRSLLFETLRPNKY